MFRIERAEKLNAVTARMDISAPLIAKKIEPGQFVIVRLGEKGEKIPLTVAGFDREKGILTIIFQAIGKSTMELAELKAGESILDVTGPLGEATPIEGHKKAVLVAGGLGCAIALPTAEKFFDLGIPVDIVLGFRSKDLVILEDEFRRFGNSLTIMTDDGSYGAKGFVTDGLRALLESESGYDIAVTIGPPIMMKAVAEVTRPLAIETLASLCPIMVDGTGMCGGCRVTVGGKTRFACVEGPDFDAHQVDFDELISRLKTYGDFERAAVEAHRCNLEARG